MTHLFVHIPKNAGMSIRHGLRDSIVVAGEGRHRSGEYTAAVLAQMNKHGEHHGFEHARWRDVRRDLQKLPAFAIVRNPWARTASRYFFGRQAVALGQPTGTNYTFTTFEEFLEERHRWGTEPYYWHRAVRGWYPQVDYVTDEDGEIRSDILRAEHLDKDLEGYMGERLPPRRRNVTTKTRPYQEIYTRQTIDIVADWYAKDIEVFGFDYDTAATRNIWHDAGNEPA